MKRETIMIILALFLVLASTGCSSVGGQVCFGYSPVTGINNQQKFEAEKRR